MVFGFGKGKMEIAIEKFNYSPGETIRGRITFNLKKPTKAKGLKVALIGERTTTRMQRDSRGGMSSRKDKSYLHNFEMPLDGEKEYKQGEYKFQIKIPENVLRETPPKGTVGDVLKAAKFLSGSNTRISWYIRAKLDIPRGRDVSKNVQINVA